MTVQLVTAMLAMALPFGGQQRGLVQGVEVVEADVRAGQRITFRVTGTNPCGAVEFTYGDGKVITLPIPTVPATLPYTFEAPGTYRVIARGQGNCDGSATTTVRVGEAPRRDDRRESEPAVRFADMDRNRDGVITRDEWRGSDASFRVHDWNRDNVLSGDEVRPGATRGASPEGREDELLDWTARRFRQLDANRDGRLTRAEWRYDAELFRRVDRNRDGVLSEAEFVGDPDDDRNDRFDDLDANHDGRIERGEWHGSAGAFNWLDRNNDGVLTRAEVGGDDAGRRAGARPVTVVVDPRQRWVDTGIDLRQGDSLAFDATGTVQLSTNADDVADPAGSRSGRRISDAPIRRALAGALIARIGDATLTVVGGRSGTLSAPRDGRLYLSVNDDYLDDNRGEFRVRISIIAGGRN